MSIPYRYPYLKVTWTASSLTTSFGGYYVLARPSRAAVEPWQIAAICGVPLGRSRSQIEAYHTRVHLGTLGWQGEQGSKWYEGWDLQVQSYDYVKKLFEFVATPDVTRTALAGDTQPWLVSDHDPWLSVPLTGAQSAKATPDSMVSRFRLSGNPGARTRTVSDFPARTYDLSWQVYQPATENRLRGWQAAALRGRQMCLQLPSGDRAFGVVDYPSPEHQLGQIMGAGATFYETSLTASPCEFNAPAGAMLDGSTEYLTSASATSLNPGTSAFTIICAGVFAGSAGSDWALSKGNVGAAAGYGFATTGDANVLSYVVQGASATATLTSTSADWFDGDIHVAAGVSTGTAQTFYRDGTSVDTDAVTTGSVTNAVALVAGGLNGGASAHMAMAPVMAYAVYLRALTATEIGYATKYLLGSSSHRMPAGASIFIDLRDDRCWDSSRATAIDLSGNKNHATLVGSPAPRGFQWPLRLLDAA